MVFGVNRLSGKLNARHGGSFQQKRRPALSCKECVMIGTDKNTLGFLMASLKEVQDTVRAYDTKAKIVDVGYIFAIGIIIDLADQDAIV